MSTLCIAAMKFDLHAISKTTIHFDEIISVKMKLLFSSLANHPTNKQRLNAIKVTCPASVGRLQGAIWLPQYK